MGQHRNTRGGALLAVLVMSVVMAIAATLALETSRDLLLGARALRTSAAAQAAAEFGIAETADTYNGWDSIATGEILDADGEVLTRAKAEMVYLPAERLSLLPDSLKEAMTDLFAKMAPLCPPGLHKT